MSKKVFVTGASSGIGKATAERFGKHGFDLIISARRKDRLKKVADKIRRKYAVNVQELIFDIRNREEVEEAFNSLDDHWKNIDILINNAGLAKGFHEIHEGEIDDWETMIDTNIKGLLYITRVISPLMVKRGKGQIINVASTAGKEVYPKGNVYCATKHAVDALTKSMRLDLHKYGIRVGQVAPGHVEETEFALVRFDGDSERANIYEDFKPVTSKDISKIIYYITNQPKHVNIQDVLVMGTQQASSNFIHRSGRKN